MVTFSDKESTPSTQESMHNASEQADTLAQRSRLQKIYNAFGFTKGYNFSFYFICVGALFAFGLSRLEDLDFNNILPFNVSIGLWYYLAEPGPFRYGMFMHVAAAVPAALLQAFQFTPVIRHKFITFHRINGYIVILLLLVSNAGCAIIIRRPVGFDISMQTSGAAVIILTTISAGMALWNIKSLQIDQHRAWMIRCIAYLGTSVSFRCVVLPATLAITSLGGFYAIWPCEQVAFTLHQYGVSELTTVRYPTCQAVNGTLSGEVIVKAAWDNTAPESKGAATSILFGPVLWLCLVLHIILVEIYLALTPREAARLRQISYERQLAAGFVNPGNAGSTVERWGDADRWKPAALA